MKEVKRQNVVCVLFALPHRMERTVLPLLSRAIQDRQGEAIAHVLRFSYWQKEVHPHEDYQSLQRLLGSVVHAAGIPAPWHAIVLNYFHACIHFLELNDSVTAFDKLVQSAKDFLKFFGAETSAWASPVCHLFLQNLCNVGQVADRQTKGHKHLEECSILYREFFKIAHKEHNQVMLAVVIANLRVYFKLKSYQKCEEMILHVTKGKTPPLSEHPISQQVTYSFYAGCVAMFSFKIVEAASKLSFAYENCPVRHHHNRRLILTYLVPLRMLQGQIASPSLLQKYSLQKIYGQVAQAFRAGNLHALRASLDEQQPLFIRLGVFLVLEKVLMLAYRNLFKKAYFILKPANGVLTLETLCNAVEFSRKEGKADPDEVECIMANLIYRKFVKGFIAKRNGNTGIKFDSKDPFPSLGDIFPRNTL